MNTPRLLSSMIALVACCCFSTVLSAQILGSAFSYQGQLKEAGLPANGLYDFQSCLFDSLLSPSTTICAPDINDAPVENGLFTIALDFGAGPFNGQQRFLELRVRPGASSGSFTILSPRQLIRAMPEALRANTTPWAGLSAMPTGFADGVDNTGVNSITAGAGLSGGTITTSGTVAIAAGGINASMIGIAAVGNSQVAADSIDSTRIIDNSIGATDIATNAVGALELDDNSVNTAAIVDGNVTSIKIANGAVGTAQINTAQVQTRIAGTCGAGEYFRGINGDGSLSCELLPVSFDRVLESNGDVGSDVSIALRSDGRPVLAHHNNTLGSLRFFSCSDAACTTGTSRTLDSAGADVGEDPTIAIRPNGFPIVAYRDVAAQSIKLYDCANENCTSGVIRTLDSTVDAQSPEMVLRPDGRAFVVYYEFTNFTLRAFDCADTDCSSGAIRSFSSTDNPNGLSVQIRSDGRPLMALGGNAGLGVRSRLFDCANVDCTTGTVRTPPTAPFSGPVALVVRSNDRPLVVNAGLQQTETIDCLDATCTTYNQTVLSPNFMARSVDVKIRGNGLPLIVFGRVIDADQSELGLFDCTSSSCSTGSKRIVVGTGDVGIHVAFALRSDGRPVIAYYDALNGDLRLRVCANPECI